MPPRLTLTDPYFGPENAAAYIDYWGDHLYRACVGAQALPYADFCARTLREGKDWWVVEPPSPTDDVQAGPQD